MATGHWQLLSSLLFLLCTLLHWRAMYWKWRAATLDLELTKELARSMLQGLCKKEAEE